MPIAGSAGRAGRFDRRGFGAGRFRGREPAPRVRGIGRRLRALATIDPAWLGRGGGKARFPLAGGRMTRDYPARDPGLHGQPRDYTASR
ncbi:hypothetical protein JCM13210_18080 [Thermaerobacter litoralis]